MIDINGRDIVLGDIVLTKRASSSLFEKVTVVGFTSKMIKVDSRNYLGEEEIRNVHYVAVVTDVPNEMVEFMLKTFNNLV